MIQALSIVFTVAWVVWYFVLRRSGDYDRVQSFLWGIICAIMTVGTLLAGGSIFKVLWLGMTGQLD